MLHIKWGFSGPWIPLFIIKYKNIVDIWWTPVFSEQLKKWGYPQKFYPGEYPRFFWTTEIVGATPIFAISLLFLSGDFKEVIYRTSLNLDC